MRAKPSGDWMLNRVTLKSSVVAQKFIQILLRSALKKQWKWMRTSTAVPTSICSVCTGSNSAGDFEFESKLTRLHSNAWRLLWIDSVANLRKHNCLLIRLLESRQKKIWTPHRLFWIKTNLRLFQFLKVFSFSPAKIDWSTRFYIANKIIHLGIFVMHKFTNLKKALRVAYIIFSPGCVFLMCFFRTTFALNRSEQCLHPKGSSFVCFKKWIFIVALLPNASPHSLHTNDFLPKWITSMCCARLGWEV